VLTRLIAGDAEGQLTEIGLIQNCIFILNAGHETTTNLIGNAIALLHDHGFPPIPDPKKMIEEVLRCASPNQFGNREAAQDTEIGGRPIAKGTNIHLCIGAANRDPAVFENPGTFDPNRSPNRHLAFAGGPHVCVGLTLARLEGRVAITRLLERYRIDITHRTQGGRVRFRGFASLKARLSLP